MNKRIKIIGSFFSIGFLSFLFLLSCCSKTRVSSNLFNQWMQPSDKIKVLSTVAMIDDIVGQIGQENILHMPLILGQIDPHSYEMVKGDDEKLRMATIVFYNGLGLEHGASLSNHLLSHKNAIALGDVVAHLVPEEMIYIDRTVDPHIWMDISLWSLIIDPIVQELSRLDPESAEFYKHNGENLLESMQRMDKKIYNAMHKFPSFQRYLVTSHDAFNYFTRAYLSNPDEEYWQSRVNAPEGLAPDGQLSSSDIQCIVNFLLEKRIQTVFPESSVNRDALNKIIHDCQKKGLKVHMANSPLYSDSMGGKDSGASNYLDMMWHNTSAILSEWEKTKDLHAKCY
ncbi:Manganese-binding lipoprotein MntA [Candidatus Rhabdochlamydia porcellionis]|jgi:manganese/zinc/iron transport system substrate-binding protein|uniref:Manganese-binding lipoprotein MntA n=1 Tax=Candidatus Rhabdochlamydia porcellionis TaxID=225148 RepID=A0ABX8YYT0_9BACT|nr:Manganese-binding lipoprotein MntA [Candidatus Rhabdochlamydia porcellionis]